MTDRELLELAAKAAGYESICYHFAERGSGQLSAAWSGDWLAVKKPESPLGNCMWNPLTNDGDALRLAVKLNMIVDCTTFSAMDGKKSGQGVHDWHSADELLGDDDAGNDAATRRAIVRAAAEIGKAME